MKYYTLFFSVLFFIGVKSQQIDYSNTRPGEDVEYCTTHKKLQELLQDPEFRKQFEEEQAQFRREEARYKSSGRKRGTVLTIPVVFHVMHSGGVENISDEQIYDALAIMNRDFRLQNNDAKTVHSDFNSLPSDVEIEFKMATIAPDGTCFRGITRTFTTDTTTNGSKQVSLIKAGNDVYKGEWAGNRYLNFFICKSIGGAAGYTYRPWGSNINMTNGIWILHTYVGSIGTSNEIKSRALTHEVGHWLNLMHTWGGNNNPGVMSSCDDPNQDYVDDTPPTIGVTRCNLNESSCGVRANVENYMDYSYCNKMFTPDQSTRMRTALLSTIGGRNVISSSSNLSLVGAINPPLCTVDFLFDKNPICAGSEVSFEDVSFNNVTTRKWLFPGGIPAESDQANPKVTYTKPGKYTVSLTVSDGVKTLTKTIEGAVTVASLPLKTPFLETFDKVSSISNSQYWNVINEGNNQAFKIINGVGYGDTVSLYLNNFKDKSKSLDAIVSTPMDLSAVKNQADVTLSFKYAYRKLTSTDNETLRIYFSNDCGKTWSVRRIISGNNLSDLTANTDWKPASKSDWKIVHVTNIISSFWNSNARIKFEFEGNGGNNLFLDEINLYPSGPVDTLVKSPIGNAIYDYTIDNVDFTIQSDFSCLGTNVNFSDTLTLKATQWKWSFQGGYPSTSIEEKPVVLYTKPGVYNVTLQASNGVSTKTITKNGYLVVDASKKDFPITENFDTIKDLKINNTWYGSKNTNQVLLNSLNAGSTQFITFKANENSYSTLVSKQLNFSKLKDTLPVYLSFDVKKSISKNADKDTLLIFLSADCGDTWNKIATLNLNSTLVKDSSKWNNVEIEEINKNYLKQFTLIKFAYKGFNELNFDNLSISNNKQIKNTASVSDISENKFTIYPNPTDQHLNVTWNTDFKVSYIMLTDVLGKKVKEISVNTQLNSIDLDLSTLSKGTYYVNLINPDFIQVSKAVMVR
jgi:PKD repeat protein